MIWFQQELKEKCANDGTLERTLSERSYLIAVISANAVPYIINQGNNIIFMR